MSKQLAKKVVVVGLDGATWNLLSPWVKKGWLPNLARIMEEGVCGNLESTLPSSTIPAWATFATGANPGVYGCFNFLMPTNSLLHAEPVNSKDVDAETFYEKLEKSGKRSVIINLPGSSPPRIKKGILLPSFISLGENSIFPPDLAEQIPEIENYKVVPDPTSWLERGNAVVNASRSLEAVRFSIAQKLFLDYDWDLFFVMFSASDWIQHRKYGELARKGLSKNSVAFKFYKEFDEYLGWFDSHLPQESVLMLISDHGFENFNYRFHVNKWLADKGLLKTKKVFWRRSANAPLGLKQMDESKASGFFSSIVKDSLSLLLSSQPIYFLLGEATRRLNRFLPPEYKFYPRGLLNAGLEIDIKNTLACSLSGTFSGIYINDQERFDDGVVNSTDYENLREEIIHGLRRLRDPKGKKVFSGVYKKEEIYSGPWLRMSPDILFSENKIIPSSELGHKTLFEESSKDEGWHANQGIFLAKGHGLKNGEEIVGTALRDVAPTILHLFGVEKPKSMEGRILKNIFPGSSLALEKKVRQSQKIIKQALSSFDLKKLAVAWTGGKDSTLLLWLVRKVCQELDMALPKIVFVDEGDIFEEVREFVDELIEDWGLRVETVSNQNILEKVKGIGDEVKVSQLNKRNKEEIKRLRYTRDSFLFEPESLVGNHLMKTVPLNIYLEKNKIDGLFTGIRWDEHPARSKEKYLSPRRKPKHTRIHPILHFNEAEVWQAIHSLSIPFNPLYKLGYRSLGVKSTTQKSSALPAWRQDLKATKERQGRRQDKEEIMSRLRQLGYM